jgi:hypothetical protein
MNRHDDKVRRIVVGVDGFESSKAALRWAIHQANLTGAVVIRSDAYELTGDGRMRPGFDGPGPVVTLDKDYYKLLPDFEQRFPAGAPSLRRCRRFEVEGDVTFGAGVVAVGERPASLSRAGRDRPIPYRAV